MDLQTDKPRRLKCLLIGPLSTHAVVGRVAAFVAAGFEVSLVNVSSENVLKKAYPISRVRIVADCFDAKVDIFDRKHRNRYQRLKSYLSEYFRSLGVIPEARQLRDRLRQVILDVKPHFVVLHYGPIAIRYARIVKRVIPQQVPVIDILNLVPSSLTYIVLNRRLYWPWLFEMTNYRRWLPMVDGVIYASREMQEYVLTKFGALDVGSLVLPDYLPVGFQTPFRESTRQHVAPDGNPSVISLGARERWGDQLDNIDEEFMQLANERIHIYSATISDKVRSTGFGHTYPRFSHEEVFAGKLASFATQFGAAIVTYNFNIAKSRDRFRSTLPTRLFTAITACMPIAVPAGALETCERFVVENGIGFSYTDAADLRRQLLDHGLMSKCRMRAIESRKQMNAEAQAGDIQRFVMCVIKNFRST